MITEVQRNHLAKAVRPMQIIVGALAASVAMFLVIVLVIADKKALPQPFLTYVALGFAVVAFAGWLIVPGRVVDQARKAIAEGRAPSSSAQTAVALEVGVVGQLASVFQTRLIIACALLEGAAFFNLVVYMIEAQYLSLVIAIVLLLIIVSQIPTRNRLEDWITHELETIEQMRARFPKFPS